MSFLRYLMGIRSLGAVLCGALHTGNLHCVRHTAAYKTVSCAVWCIRGCEFKGGLRGRGKGFSPQVQEGGGEASSRMA